MKQIQFYAVVLHHQKCVSIEESDINLRAPVLERIRLRCAVDRCGTEPRGRISKMRGPQYACPSNQRNTWLTRVHLLNWLLPALDHMVAQLPLASAALQFSEKTYPWTGLQRHCENCRHASNHQRFWVCARHP